MIRQYYYNNLFLHARIYDNGIIINIIIIIIVFMTMVLLLILLLLLSYL